MSGTTLKLLFEVEEEAALAFGVAGVFEAEHRVVGAYDVNAGADTAEPAVGEPAADGVVGIALYVADVAIGLEVDGEGYVAELRYGHVLPVIDMREDALLEGHFVQEELWSFDHIYFVAANELLAVAQGAVAGVGQA